MPVSLSRVRFETSPTFIADLAGFYGDALGLPLVDTRDGSVAIAAGEAILEFQTGRHQPFYHYAILVPGDRFGAAHRWAAERVGLLPDADTGTEVFEFENWDAQAVYFLDPAGNIGELIAHRGIGVSGRTGRFDPDELLGLSEVGLVGDPQLLADALAETFGLRVWSGSVGDEGRLGFVGEKARTLILSPTGRPWLPTGRPAEAHPVEVVLAGVGDGEVQLASGVCVRGSARLT